MSDLLSLHLDKVPDPTIVPAGQYQLRIITGAVEPSKSSDRDVIKCMCEIVDEPTAQPVFVNMALPLKTDDDKKTYNLKLQIKQFFQAFQIDPGAPGKPDEWKGAEGWAYLKVEPDNNGQDRNVAGRWIAEKAS